jgi:hypothetical protein
MDRSEKLQLSAAIPLLGFALFLIIKFPVLMTGLGLMGAAVGGWASQEKRSSFIELLLGLLVGAVVIFDLQFNDASLLNAAGSGFVRAFADGGPTNDTPDMR